ncbi:MAG: hypothetical protein APR63_06865 [Desulfuromonas sp. SDB]|nr:MAG: hypothetical protein APR63_06865 [Desulfuromonas sp. SDB]
MSLSKLLQLFLLVLCSGIIFVYSCSTPPPIEIEPQDTYQQDTVKYNYDTIFVEVLNGTDINNLARYIADTIRMMKYIENQTMYRFDVINVDNWNDPDLDRCFVVDRRDTTGYYAKIVSSATAIKPPLIEIKTDAIFQVTVIIGPDYARYFGELDSMGIIW